MRFIYREGLTPPEILFSKRAEEARADVAAFIEQTYSKGGTRRAPSSHWLDYDRAFQEEVAQRFKGVCAYCESEAPYDVTAEFGIIGRHRPEALAQGEDGKTDLLSYVWLMYEWENLLWVCPECARRKGNRFFVDNKRGEPSMPVAALREAEGELILDPCFHQMYEHLVFDVSGAVSRRTACGQATLDLLELNRKDLVKSRRQAVLDLADRLSDPFIWHSGGETLESCLREPDDTSRLLSHTGATTHAVLAFSETQGYIWSDPAGFLEEYSARDADDRNAFVYALRNQAVGPEPIGFASEMFPSLKVEKAAPSLPTSAPKAQRRRPLPDVHTLPNALKPITHVEIENFKALRKIAFALPEVVPDADQSPCMLLLGENAMGKSSVLEAMALAVIGAREADELNGLLKDEEVSPMGLIHRPDPYLWDQTADHMRVQLDFLDTATPVLLEAGAGASRFDGAQDCAKVVLAYGPRRYFTSRKSRRLRAPAHRVRSLFDPMDMIANPIHWLATLDDPQFFAAARALREVLMLDDEDDFERDTDPKTPGQIYIWQNGQRVAMKDLSVGFKSIIAMVTDIIREMLYHFDNLEFASGVVFVDEIETHLHPRWKMRIMTLLRRAFPKVQFIVTTHDPLCLQGMYDGEVFVLHRAPETDHVEPVSDLPSIRGMRAEQILTSEFFGLGSTDPETDARLARYNYLAAQIEDLTKTEQSELERLRTQLDDGMVLGTTLREQAYAEALKERDEARQVRPTKVRSPRRADLKTEFSNLFNLGGDR